MAGCSGEAFFQTGLVPTGQLRRDKAAGFAAMLGLVVPGTRITGHPEGSCIPGNDLAVCVEAALALADTCGLIGFPAILVGARPLHTHGFADRARQHKRVDSDVIGSVLAIAARRFSKDEMDLLIRKAKELSDGFTGAVRRLRTAPKRHAVGANVG